MVQAGRRAVYEPRGARVREADAVERDRVPAQGADVRALLGDHAARLDVPPPAAGLPRRGRLAPAAPLRQRDPAPRRCSRSSVALVADGWAYGIVLAGQVALIARGRGRRADRPVLRARHLGDRRGALELPPTWRARRRGRPRRARGEPRSSTSLGASLGLAVASPLLAASALAIKLEDGGPVLFRQTRVGKDGKDFELLKLRTMVVDAERKGAGLRGRRGRQPDHARRPAPAPDVRSTSCRSSGTSSAAR